MTDFMTSRHTPGPWHVYNVQTDPFARVGTYKHAICTMAPSGNVYADAANARLIAAAPELLAALEAFMGADDKMQVAIGGNPIYVDRFLARVRALLAKAKGGEYGNA